MTKNKFIVKNTDLLTTDYTFQECGWRTQYLVSNYPDLDVVGGSVFIHTKLGWYSMYQFHFWCVDTNDNLYDSHSSYIASHDYHQSLVANGKTFKLFNPPTNFSYRVFDVDDFTPENYLARYDYRLGDTMDASENHTSNVEKWLNKYIPKGKYDLIYVEGLMYNDGGYLFTQDRIWNLWDKFAITPKGHNINHYSK